MNSSGDLLDVCFSVDTTGSMAGFFNDVKGNIQFMIKRLFAWIPNVRISVIAHGDYCDEDIYITTHHHFTDNEGALIHWVRNLRPTNGGDGDECYELVLREVQSLNWRPGSKRVLILIGDANPHEPGYKYSGKTHNINWKDEALKLLMMDVRIIGVQYGFHRSAQHFFNAISTDGRSLKYTKFLKIYDEIVSTLARRKEAVLLRKNVQRRLRDTVINRELTAMYGNNNSRCHSLADIPTTPDPALHIQDIAPAIPAVQDQVLNSPNVAPARSERPEVNVPRKKNKVHFKPKHERLKERRRSERIKHKEMRDGFVVTYQE